MDDDTGMVLAAALTGALFVVLLVLVTVVLVLRRWRREAVASSRGFVLFGVCFHDESQGRVARPSTSGRNRRWAPRGADAATSDDQDPDECELASWKKMFGGPARCLSTIDEGTEKGTTPFTTPAFCTPASSPDRRDARTLHIATGAVQS